MKKSNIDPLVNLVLDDEELMIEQALENNEYEDVDIARLEKTKELLREAAQRDRKSDTIAAR